jgi:hypothetical protein
MDEKTRLEVIAVACYQALHCASVAMGTPTRTWTSLAQSERDLEISRIRYWDSVVRRLDAAFLDEDAGWDQNEMALRIHIEWVDSLVNDGWSYGKELDPAAKQHPLLVDFSDLPPGVRARLAAQVETYLAISGLLPSEDVPQVVAPFYA